MKLKYLASFRDATARRMTRDMYSVSQKKTLRFSADFSETAGNFNTKFYTFIKRYYLHDGPKNPGPLSRAITSFIFKVQRK